MDATHTKESFVKRYSNDIIANGMDFSMPDGPVMKRPCDKCKTPCFSECAMCGEAFCGVACLKAPSTKRHATSASSKVELAPKLRRTAPVGRPSTKSTPSPHTWPLPLRKFRTTSRSDSSRAAWHWPGLQKQPVRSWIGGRCRAAIFSTSV